MVRKTNRKVKEIITEYVKNVPKDIQVSRVILFGSYARGAPHKDSDFDLIVLSPNFKRMAFMKRLELLSHVQGASSMTRAVPMDIIGYTPEEFATIDKESVIMRQAKKEGKVIYSAANVS